MSQIFMSSIAVETGIQTLSGDTGGKVSSDITGNIGITAGPGIYTLSQPGSNSVLVGRAEFVVGSITTTDATPTSVVSFSMAPFAGVFTIKGTISAYDKTDVSGSGYFFSGAFRTTGAAGTLIGSNVENTYSDPSMALATISIGATGNDIVITVKGLPAKTIDWAAEFDYVLAL